MKTRIKVRHYADGSKTYQMQYNGLSILDKGVYLVPIYGWIAFIAEKFFWCSPKGVIGHEHFHLDSAKKEIDDFLKKIEDKKAINLSNKKVKTEYIKYP